MFMSSTMWMGKQSHDGNFFSHRAQWEHSFKLNESSGALKVGKRGLGMFLQDIDE